MISQRAVYQDNTSVIQTALRHVTMGLLLVAAMVFFGVSPINHETGVVAWVPYVGSIIITFGCILGIYFVRSKVTQYSILYTFFLCVGYGVEPSVYMAVSKTGSYAVVLQAAVLTAMATLVASFYGYSTKSNLGYLGTFVLGAMIVLVVGMVMNLFIGSGMLSLMISYAVVVVMMGSIAYDIWTAKHSDVFQAPMLAMSLFISIINIFIHLLHILSSDDD